MDNQLKPCPFCGSEAQMIHGDGPFCGRVQIDCTNCRNATWWWDEAVAVRSWNKRAALPSDAAGAPVAWRHSHTHCLYETREAVPLADADEWAEPLYAAPVAPAAVAPEIAAWQSIETAPKDGRTVLLGYLNEAGKWRTVRGQWMSEAYIAEYWEDPDDVEPGWFETSAEADDVPNCWRVEPTHWMPLPVSPNSAPTPTVAADAAAPKIVAHPGERVSMTYEQYVALRDGSAAQPDERAAPVGRMEMFSGKHGLTWLVDPQSLPAGTHLYARAAAPQAALDEIVYAVQAYGDARADGGDSADAIGKVCNLLRAIATAPTERMSDAARDVLAERVRQVSVEGFTAEHDDEHDPGVLASAGMSYTAFAADLLCPMSLGDSFRDLDGKPPMWWPWDASWWKATTPRRALEKAAALIIGEIEHIDRAARKAEIERSGSAGGEA
ncbi:Lar family restriction alleviation protein [Paraburkholderia tropica]|uniref:Lar family restriction alleviation protein n=1 Tax=Paraburkholderia tropica TaxID=92647 RepID=UPI003015B026